MTRLGPGAVIIRRIRRNVVENELAQTQTVKLISDLTETTIPFVGEALRTSKWPLAEEAKSGF